MSRRCGGIYLIRCGSCDQACSSWSSSASTSPHTPSAAVNWASTGEGRGVPASVTAGQVGIRLNEALLIPLASVDETVVPSAILTETERVQPPRCLRAGSSTWRSFSTTCAGG